MRIRTLDKVALRGDLRLQAVAPDGRILRTIVVRNKVTYVGADALITLLFQNSGDPTDYQLATLVPGTNGTPATYGDTSVYAPILDTLALGPSNRTRAGSGSGIVTATLDTTQGNGNTLREVGILMGNGDLFARQATPDFDKTNAFSVIYTWRFGVRLA